MLSQLKTKYCNPTIVNIFFCLMLAGCVFSVNANQLVLASVLPKNSKNIVYSSETTNTWDDFIRSFPANVKLKNIELLKDIYTTQHIIFPRLWQNEQARQLFQKQLTEVALIGITPEFSQWLMTLMTTKSLTSLQQDVLLSDMFLSYMGFVRELPINGKAWLYGRQKVKLITPLHSDVLLWKEALSEGKLIEFISSFAPQHPDYIAMQAALWNLVHQDNLQSWPKLTATRSIRPKMKDDDITAIRDILSRIGYYDKSAKNITDTNINFYDNDLVAAVKSFQQQHGLTADGIIGKNTRVQLSISNEQRIGILALNMQRLRLIPGNIRDGIFVNIPDYSLVFYRNGKRILESRVIVGKVTRKTPLVNKQLNSIVLNPPWNVPIKLIREDLIPKIKKDPSYLKKNNYKIYANWNNDAIEIAPGDIDWNNVSPKAFSYRIKQSAGYDSALGRYKFGMPGNDAIYLHDTPNHGLFNKEMRALSSGCVRVNKAEDLAQLILEESGWQRKTIMDKVSSNKTIYISIKKSILVELYYLTAWVEQGKPIYRVDIYNYDHVIKVDTNLIKQVIKINSQT